MRVLTPWGSIPFARPTTIVRRILIPLLLAGSSIPGSTAAWVPRDPPRPAPGRKAVATVLSQAVDSVTIHFEAPNVVWTSGGGYVYPLAAGFGNLQEIAHPALPIRIERVAIPPGAKPRLTILETQFNEAPSGLVGPVQRWVPTTPGSTDRVPLNIEDPTVYGSNDLWPSTDPVRLGTMGALREQAFVELIFTPVLHRPASRSSVVYRSITVRVDFGVVAESLAPGVEPDFEVLYDLGLVNAGQGREFRASGRTSDAQDQTASAPADAMLTPQSAKYKLTINRDALYRLSVSWVNANAPGLLTRDPTEYRMECLGQLVPITVNDTGVVGTFEGSDYIEFYGQALTWDLLSPDDWNDGDFTDDNVYWLYADSSGGLRTTTRSGTPSSGFAIPLDFSETLHHEVNNRFVGQVPEDPVDHHTPDHWYENPVLAANGNRFDGVFNVNTPGVSTNTTTGSIKVRFLGDNYANNYHRTTISVNGSAELGPYDWDGWVEKTQGVDNGPTSFPQSQLISGATPVTVSLPLGRDPDGDGTSIARDQVFVNWIEITYGRRFRVDTDVDGDGTLTNDQMLIFSVPNPSVGTQIRLTGFSQSSCAIYEITKSLSGTPLANPVRITGAQLTGAAAPFQFDFQFSKDNTMAVGAPRRFIVATTTTAVNTGDLVPAAVKLDVPSTLHSPASGVDWLVIANASLIPSSGAWTQLVSRRASQGLRVANQGQGGFVDLEDVYDEFSFGIQDPQAIRDFIAYVYQSWPRIDPNVPVKYVLLIGDGSYDYKNSYGYPQNKNLLPPYMRSSQSPILGYLSDESYFSGVFGSEDPPLPDVFLGRWPVHSTTETNAVAQKILAYEGLPQTSPWQPWQYDVVFVADDASDDTESGFETIQEDQIRNHLQTTAHTYHRVYEEEIAFQNPDWDGSMVAAEVNDRIIRQINGDEDPGHPGRDIGPGAAILSYVGHGSWQNWGSNTSFVVTSSTPPPPNDDVDDLSNGAPNWRLPFFLIADCLSGAFAAANTTASTDLTYALGDDYLVTPNKGAIGILAPSHLTFNVGHSTIENTFFDLVYGTSKIRNVGTLAFAIQIAFAASQDWAALQGNTLLADPALNLTIPAPKPPSNVTATPGNHQVGLSWSASPDAPANYTVYQGETATGSYQAIATVSGSSTSYTSSNLTNCQTYYYSLTSRSASPVFEGPRSDSNDGCLTGGSCVRATPLNPSAPSVPTGLTVTDSETGGAVSAQWSPNPTGDDVGSYTLYWGTSPGPPYANSMAQIASTTVPVTGLMNDQTYYFAVSGSNCSRGEGSKSPPVSVVPHRIEGIKPPNSIGNLMVSRSLNNARLQWTPPTTNIYGQPLTAPGPTLSSQEVYSGTTPNFTVDAAHRLSTLSCPCSSPSSYIHTNGFSDPLNHYYLIVAVDSLGNRSAVRDELPRGIDQLTVRRSGGNLIFSWPAVTLDVDGGKTVVGSYSLYGRATTPMSRSQIGPSFLIQSNITSTTRTLPMPAGTLFYYSVIAVDNRGALSPW